LDKASVTRAETLKACDILRCPWRGPGTYSLDLLGVDRYAMIAHHMAKKRNRLLKDNALLRLDLRPAARKHCNTEGSLLTAYPNSLPWTMMSSK